MSPQAASSCKVSDQWCMMKTCVDIQSNKHTVDGRNPTNYLRLVVYPIIYKVLYIPGGAGIPPSTVGYLMDNLKLIRT